ncbi:hypothetical protein, partial [Bradyrhizobium japonicum]|uniref:hypothetical protein n=1 Tax=Bradyrhizobium japonicum TaxID=375 RepID=UPI001AEBDCD4
FAPDSQQESSPLSGRKSTQATVRICGASSDRYNKAYGAGLFTVEQLREYTTPLREKLTSLKNTIASAQQQTNASYVTEMPSADEIKQFSDAAQTALQ